MKDISPVINKKERAIWLDLGRGICMICVYLLHCQYYYGIGDIDYGFFVSPFYVSLFFFLSGYLLYKEKFSTKKKLKDIATKMLYPLIIFSTLLYVPKHLFHGNLNLNNFFIDILGGTAMWFISALIVSQLCVIIIIQITKNTYVRIFLCLCLFLSALFLKEIYPSHFPWEWKQGMVASLFVILGYTFRQNEKKIENRFPFLWSKSTLCLLVLSYLIIMILNYKCWNITSSILGVRYDNIPVNLLIEFWAIIMMVSICKQLKSIPIIIYIGKNSLLFYFVCGMLPAAIGFVFKKIPIEPNYLMTLLCTTISLAFASIICFLIKRYAPFLLNAEYFFAHDKRKSS